MVHSSTSSTTGLAFIADNARHELLSNILPFWSGFADWNTFGFYGASDADDAPIADAPKSCVLNARILYTFARAYRQLGHDEHKALAKHALQALTDYFYQPETGTLAWMLDHQGHVIDDENHLYNTSFVIYALAEWVRATGDPAALALAHTLFLRVESECQDLSHGGYLEAFDRHWQPIPNTKLCDTEAGVITPKSMNTHLHLMEAYANLARAAPDCGVQPPLKRLIELLLARQVSPRGAWFDLFFERDWTVASGARSFGHDIEGSWLLCDAVSALTHPDPLDQQVKTTALAMADATLRDALAADGSLLNELDAQGTLDQQRVWWVQIEGLVGLVNAYQYNGLPDYRQAAARLWQFIQHHLIDGQREWHWQVDGHGRPGPQTKVSAWKCPYHNGPAAWN